MLILLNLMSNKIRITIGGRTPVWIPMGGRGGGGWGPRTGGRSTGYSCGVRARVRIRRPVPGPPPPVVGPAPMGAGEMVGVMVGEMVGVMREGVHVWPRPWVQGAMERVSAPIRIKVGMWPCVPFLTDIVSGGIWDQLWGPQLGFVGFCVPRRNVAPDGRVGPGRPACNPTLFGWSLGVDAFLEENEEKLGRNTSTASLSSENKRKKSTKISGKCKCYSRSISSLPVSTIGYGTIASKINVTPPNVLTCPFRNFTLITKVKFVTAVKFFLQSAAVNCSYSVTFGGNIYFARDGTYTSNALHLPNKKKVLEP